MPRKFLVPTLIAVAILWYFGTAYGQSPEPPAPQPTAEEPAAEEPAAAEPVAGEPVAGEPVAAAEPFDPEAATQAYLNRLSPEEKASSDAYFEGGYWLQLWGFLYGLGVAWLLLGTGLSAKMRNLAEKITRIRVLATALYALQYILVTSLLSFPLSIYAGFFREHQYNLSNQTFGSWLGDQGKGLGLGLIMGTIAILGIYWVLRKAPKTWWLWGTGAAMLFMAFAMLITPVWINPLFNQYTRLEDPAVKGPILALAGASGVPTTDVWVSDASRQSKRISANVSGFAGTERITLNDNLLNRTSLPEIKAVMGHEIGHYALNHVYELLIEFGLVIAFGFAFLSWSFDRVRKRWGQGWGIREIGDTAGLPLLGALLSVFFFVATPITNSIIRINEAEADIYGLNASQEPDGFAEVALKLGEYRKLAPGPVEEFLFFDHPSGKNRILMAMRWKAAHLAATAGEPPSGGPQTP